MSKSIFSKLFFLSFIFILLSCKKDNVIKLDGTITISNIQVEDWNKVKSAVLLDGAITNDNIPNMTKMRDASKVIGRFALGFDGNIDEKKKTITLAIPSNFQNQSNIKYSMGASDGDVYNGLSLYVMDTTLDSNGNNLIMGSWSRIFLIKETVKISKDGNEAITVKALKRR